MLGSELGEVLPDSPLVLLAAMKLGPDKLRRLLAMLPEEVWAVAA